MTTYTTKQGDTWDIISYLVYGSEMHTDALFKSNLNHADVAIFDAGVVINLPEIEEKTSVSVPPWMRGADAEDSALEQAPEFDFDRSRSPSYRIVNRYVNMMKENVFLQF